MKLLSTEAEGVNVAIPESDQQVFVNSAGRVGALLGLKSADAGMELQFPARISLTAVLLVNDTACAEV